MSAAQVRNAEAVKSVERYSIRPTKHNGETRWELHVHSNECSVKCRLWAANHTHHPIGWLPHPEDRRFLSQQLAVAYWGPIVAKAGLKLE